MNIQPNDIGRKIAFSPKKPWPIRFFAHQGAWDKEKEQNTEIAFRKAVHRKAEGIELDVWASTNELRVTHDKEKISQAPSLTKVLETVSEEATKPGNKRPLINVELKGSNTALLLIRLIGESEFATNEFIVSAFIEDKNGREEKDLIDELRYVSNKSELPIAILTRWPEEVERHLELAHSLKACSVHMKIKRLDEKYADRISLDELALYGWTIKWSKRDSYAQRPINGLFVDKYKSDSNKGLNT